MDPFLFKADLEQQAAQEFVNLMHTSLFHNLFRTLGRLFRLMWWRFIHAVQMVIQVRARSLGQSQMNAAARQRRETSRERLIDNQQ